MLVLEKLSRVRTGIAALAVLGVCELFAIDVFANYLFIFSITESGLFLGASILIALLSAVVLCFSVLKIWVGHGRGHYLEAVEYGAIVGASAGMLVCAAVLAFGSMGMGAIKLMRKNPIPGTQSDPAGFLLLSCAAVIALYVFGGALMGAWTAIATPAIERRMAGNRD